jgi:hypothetical protein
MTSVEPQEFDPLEAEAVCFRIVRHAVWDELPRQRLGAEIRHIGLSGWYPGTRMIVEVDVGGEDHRAELPIWGVAPSEETPAETIASIIYGNIEEMIETGDWEPLLP